MASASMGAIAKFYAATKDDAVRVAEDVARTGSVRLPFATGSVDYPRRCGAFNERPRQMVLRLKRQPPTLRTIQIKARSTLRATCPALASLAFTSARLSEERE